MALFGRRRARFGTGPSNGYRSTRSRRVDPFGGNDLDLGRPPVRRPRRRRWLRIVVAAAVCAPVVVGIVVAANGSDSDTSGDQDLSLPTMQPRPSAPAEIPGWVAVTDSGDSIAYDVPPDWHVSYVGDGQTIEDGSWSLTMSMMASYLDGYCESAVDSFRAQSGAATVPQPDGTLAATDTARRLADAVYGPEDSGAGAAPTVTLSTPRTVLDNGRSGTLVTATVTLHKPDECDPPTALLDVFALPNPSRHESLVVVAYADQRFTGAVPQHDLDTIVTSMRQLPTGPSTEPAPTH